MPDSHSRSTLDPTLVDLASLSGDIICPGCQLTATDESGDSFVVAFGEFFFHVDCFKCAKCGDKITDPDASLLLRAFDGQPVCSNCSFHCDVCHQAIFEDAISTGDHLYHERCFKCRTCHNRIEELIFARTSLGIYCMDCHNARMRRRAQLEKERADDIVHGFEGSSFRGGHSDTSNDENEGEGAAMNSAGDEPTPELGTPNKRSAILPSSTPPTPLSPASPNTELNGVTTPPIKPTASFQISADRSPPAHNLSQTILDTHSLTTSDSARLDPVLRTENEVCKRCRLRLRRENGRAVVIMFGNSSLHVDCFKCARCNNRIDVAADLVLLVDDQPVCAACTYRCSTCHEAILDDALVIGDEVYHSHCFKCSSCYDRIDGSLFARTSDGICCMDCHNKLVTRIRRRAQVQRERLNVIADPFERSSLSGGHLVPEPKTPDKHFAVLPSSTPPARQSAVSPGPKLRPASISNAPAWFTETTSQAAASTALEGSEDPNMYSRVPGLRLRGKQSNYQRNRQGEPSARQTDYNLLDTDDDVDVDNDEEKDNFPEEFFDVETGSYNGPRSIKTMSKQSFSTWSIFTTGSSRTSRIFG